MMFEGGCDTGEETLPWVGVFSVLKPSKEIISCLDDHNILQWQIIGCGLEEIPHVNK